MRSSSPPARARRRLSSAAARARPRSPCVRASIPSRNSAAARTGGAPWLFGLPEPPALRRRRSARALREALLQEGAGRARSRSAATPGRRRRRGPRPAAPPGRRRRGGRGGAGPSRGLAAVPPEPPVRPQGDAQAQGPLALPVGGQPAQRRAQVLVRARQTLEPRRLLRPLQGRRRRLGQGEQVRGVEPAHRRRLARGREPFAGELAHRLQQPEAGLAGHVRGRAAAGSRPAGPPARRPPACPLPPRRRRLRRPPARRRRGTAPGAATGPAAAGRGGRSSRRWSGAGSAGAPGRPGARR